MRQNAELWKPFRETLLKVLWTRGWEVTILDCSVVINEILNCSLSFIYDTLWNTQTNWRKTNGKKTENFIREMWHRLQELSVFYCKSGFPVCPVQASYELIFCPSAFTQRSKEELSFSCCPLLPSWEQKVNTSVAAATPESGNSLVFLSKCYFHELSLVSRKENK